MSDGVAIDANGHRVWLKWHRLQRERTDIPFTARRLREGLALGASMEIDLRRDGEAGFAVMHDDTLDRETTGSGPVAHAKTAALRTLKMRRPDGGVTGEPLLLLDDLARLAEADAAPGTIIQLDLKEDDRALDDTLVFHFGQAITPVAGRFILSGGDWQAVSRLGATARGLKLGFDPCLDASLDQLTDGRAVERFIEDALATAPEASLIYLDYRIVLVADGHGVDIVAAFHRVGKMVDAYTLNANHPNAEQTLRRLVLLKVDQITTDEPIVLQDLYEAGGI